MAPRLIYAQQSPDPFKKLMELSGAVHGSSAGGVLQSLVEIRASQMNGCAFCLDMHIKQAKIRGESELRQYHIAIWRESPLFDAREKAALAWTEALTKLSDHGVSDEQFAAARAAFSEKELSDLTFAVALINTWNRLSIAFRNVPGSQDKAFGLDKAGLG
jgi:AhpD family alkylhydroperoxidase